MKHFYLLFSIALLSAACSKDSGFDPLNPKNGQEVALFMDHYTTGTSARIFLNTGREELPGTYIDKFPGREMGYTYIIKATVVRPQTPLVDGPSYWFEYKRTVNKEKYQGLDTFALPLFGAAGPFPYFCLVKDGDQYYYKDHPLTPFNNQVKTDLETVFEQGPPLVDSPPSVTSTITLRVQHDPANYSKGYLVYKVTH